MRTNQYVVLYLTKLGHLSVATIEAESEQEAVDIVDEAPWVGVIIGVTPTYVGAFTRLTAVKPPFGYVVGDIREGVVYSA